LLCIFEAAQIEPFPNPRHLSPKSWGATSLAASLSPTPTHRKTSHRFGLLQNPAELCADPATFPIRPLRSSYDINLQNLFRLQRFFMASMRRPRLVGLSQA
jgi:hypothetical protein